MTPRRFVVVGAGAIGGVVGCRLALAGYDVALVARGAHRDAIAAGGLRLEEPGGSWRLDLPVAETAAEHHLGAGDVVLLCVKSQDTAAALDATLRPGDRDIPVVCLQNGVENERAALRRTASVYAVPVMCPAGHLEPGVVEAYSAPVPGIFDVGRYPAGVDDVAEAVAAAFAAAGLSALAQRAVMRFKYAKLLMNLANVVDALCSGGEAAGELIGLARAEGEAALAAASVDVASDAEFAERRGDLIRPVDLAGRRRARSSSWQSLERRSGSIETDYLNGEVVLLGRIHGVDTPVNALLQHEAARAAAASAPPGGVDPAELLRRVRSGETP